jgi:hypothetical protein
MLRGCREDRLLSTTTAGLAALTAVAGRSSAGSDGGDVAVPTVDGVAVSDVWFVLLTLAMFGLLALIARGSEKL